jgi:hypothetical protein
MNRARPLNRNPGILSIPLSPAQSPLLSINPPLHKRHTPTMHRGPPTRVLLMILVHRTPIPTSARIILIAILIANLSSALAAPILSSLGEALVEIGADDALVQLRAADVLHAVQRVLVRVVFYEAEAAGRLLEAVEAHYEALDFAAFGEEFVDLFFGCVE